jgi:3'-phosphoadenosine 5'-phosphosulfate sulfotransferase (PAPS reductase)/FAD synthetase
MSSKDLQPHPMYAHLSQTPPPPLPKVDEMLEKSREILAEALSRYDPYASVAMISGGKDSICAFYVMKRLGCDVTHILHGVTGTGIEDTTHFVRRFSLDEQRRTGIKYLEANAAGRYEEYVMKKGFFGTGGFAHQFSYHILKSNPFRSVMTQVRERRRSRKIFMINGARFWESTRRGTSPDLMTSVREDKGNIWVNILQDWRKVDRDAFLEEVDARMNPVTKVLCRSGECMCGTMQSASDREEATFFYPRWGNWLNNLEVEVMKKFPWRWGEARPNPHLMKLPSPSSPLSIDDEDIPLMCVDCITKKEEEEIL